MYFCEPLPGSVPHVWFMTRRSPWFAGDYVEPNNEENGRMAADYLVQKGHKVAASPDAPRFIVETDEGKRAAHKPEALTKE